MAALTIYVLQIFPLALLLAFAIAGWKRVRPVLVTIFVAALTGVLGAKVLSIWAAAGIGLVFLLSYALGRGAASMFYSRRLHREY